MKHLPINGSHYIKLEEGFKEWLKILGYAPVSVVSHPRMVREFFYHLESIGINSIEQVENETVYGYFDYLKSRKKLRDNGAMTNNYMNKHLQTIKRFSDYLRDAHGKSFTTDMLAFTVDTPPQTVLHQKEIELLYKAVPDDIYGVRDSVMLDIYYGCGLRQNEEIGRAHV